MYPLSREGKKCKYNVFFCGLRMFLMQDFTLRVFRTWFKWQGSLQSQNNWSIGYNPDISTVFCDHWDQVTCIQERGNCIQKLQSKTVNENNWNFVSVCHLFLLGGIFKMLWILCNLNDDLEHCCSVSISFVITIYIIF